MLFNATFNNISVISWWLVLLVEETGMPRENHRQVRHTLSHNVVHLDLIWDSNSQHQWLWALIASIGSCKSNYHTVTTTTVPCISQIWIPLLWSFYEEPDFFLKNIKSTYRYTVFVLFLWCIYFHEFPDGYVKYAWIQI